MFLINYCKEKINDMSYDIRIKKEEKDKLINRYSLDKKGSYKELWENNVCITLSKDQQFFQYIEDINYTFQKDKFIREVIFKECPSYNFYQVHQEDIYQLYETKNEDITIQLKEYDAYLTLSVLCDDLNNFYQHNLF